MNARNPQTHEAEAYLRNSENPTSLYVKINGSRRRLFINRNEGIIGIIAKGKRKKGYVFNDWNSIEQIHYPTGSSKEERERKLVLKYQKLAKRATFTNNWLEDIAHADLTKSLYENHITTGNAIDGKCIKLSTLAKYCGSSQMDFFLNAVKTCCRFSSCRFDFCGYDGSLWCEPHENGTVTAGFNKEYRNCANGYYYLLINDDTLIGYDIE